MKPARTSAFGSAFFKTPSVSVPPRMEAPSVRTRWNSEFRVSRRDFGKRRRLCIAGILICATAVVSGRASTPLAEDEWQRERLPYNQRRLYSKSLPGVHSGKTSQNSFADYGVAEAAGEDVVSIVVFVSVLLSVAGEGFTTVVLVSFFSPAGGFTVSVFCSQAASNDAAPAKMQMYFFISCRWKTQYGSFHIRGKGSFRPYAGLMFTRPASPASQWRTLECKADHVPQPRPEW